MSSALTPSQETSSVFSMGNPTQLLFVLCLPGMDGWCRYQMLSPESACNMYISRSLAQGPTPCVTLYVSQNGTVPQFVVNHLPDVRARLAQIKTLSAKSGISWDIEDSEMVQKDGWYRSVFLPAFLWKTPSSAVSEHDLDDCSDYVKGATKDSKTTPEEHSL